MSDSPFAAQNSEADDQIYRVLARKYRPQNFDQLIGQDALVRTLKNAISSGRIAHAFMLTGVRGVGKTTTARIIAKALNYTGADGTAGPTTGPTDDCETCRAIAQDRHPDVMEMDAASRTGINDIREILDGVRYAPISARYKVYIIDEVHMLSTSAFNALLKTLEEPPPHVKFIFATTEIRKVPVTVLSRCQRFDLRRVDVEMLSAHYAKVCEAEGMAAEFEAIAMIARAADGSVRDGLSILDQAMALGDGALITADQVRQMLGLADRSQLLDLVEFILGGDAAKSLGLMADLYRAGADAQSVLQDILDITHLMTKFVSISAPPVTVEPNMAERERTRAAEMAKKTGIAQLTRIWQILLKGLGEIAHAPNPQSAAEMVVIRLIYSGTLPDPGSIIKQLKDGSLSVSATISGGAGAAGGGASGGAGGFSGLGGGGLSRSPQINMPGHYSGGAVQGGVTQAGVTQGGAKMMPHHAHENLPLAVANNNLGTLADVVALLEQNGAMSLAAQIVHHMELVKLDREVIEFRPTADADKNLAHSLGKKLLDITGRRWMIVSSNFAPNAAPTLAVQAAQAQDKLMAEIIADPVIARVLAAFPLSKIEIVEG
ncbi:MAG: DNA polymerase III subunit gamma/tau [Alphaproteobacteria bacterium]|nr:DNA polymerase III subunit gamma/tau [Alphaproteobacteria bacterium]